MDNYNSLLDQFINILKRDNPTLNITVSSGSKYDKIIFDGKPRYFVTRKQINDIPVGDIFGAKNTVAPNYRWFFGSLITVPQWEWSGYHGKPVSDNTVEVLKHHGSYIHYIRKSE